MTEDKIMQRDASCADENKSFKLVEKLRERPDLQHLTYLVTIRSGGNFRYASYVETVNCIKISDRNNCRLLSKIFPYFPFNSVPVMF